MIYLVEVRKAKQEDKYFFCPFNDETYHWETQTRSGDTTISEFPVILAEISETDFSEAVNELEGLVKVYQNDIDMEYLVESAVPNVQKQISNLQSAINILKHLSK